MKNNVAEIQSKEKPVSNLLKTIIFYALSLIERYLIPRIGGEVARKAAAITIIPLRKSTEVLNDDDPQNGQQIEKVWLSFANNEVLSLADNTLQNGIAKIQNEHVRVSSAHLGSYFILAGKLLTDEEKDNSAQLDQLWRNFAKAPFTHEIVLEHLLQPVLENALPEEIVGFIKDLIAEALRNGTSKLNVQTANRIAALYAGNTAQIVA